MRLWPRKGRSKPRRVSKPDDQMTLIEHLAELRMRLIRAILAVTVGAVLVFAFYDPVLEFLRHPYDHVCATQPSLQGKCQFIFTDPLQGFATRVRVAGYGGLVLALPVVMWQIWRFVTPALHSREKRYAIPFVISSVVLFAAGGVLAYVFLPKGLQWLISWSGTGTEPAFTPDRYISFVTLVVLAFGIGFLFPVLLVFLEVAGIINYKQLASWRRPAVVFVVASAAILTPGGDLFSNVALAVPMYIFYELSIVIGWVLDRRRRKREAAAAV
jgi:sec-independent protein translocase protein TatC